MRFAIIVIFLGVALSIFLYFHTTPTGYFYLPSENVFVNFSFYYKCNSRVSEEPIFLEFLKLKIKAYQRSEFCQNICKKLKEVYNADFKSRIAKDDYDNIVCLCQPKNQIVFGCKNNISKLIDLSDILSYIIEAK